MKLCEARKALSRVLDQLSRDCIDEHGYITVFSNNSAIVSAVEAKAASSVHGPNYSQVYFFADGSALVLSNGHGGKVWRLHKQATVPQVFGFRDSYDYYLKHWLHIPNAILEMDHIDAKGIIKFWASKSGYKAARFDEQYITDALQKHYPYLLPKEVTKEGVQ